jgi:hypothetical protein
MNGARDQTDQSAIGIMDLKPPAACCIASWYPVADISGTWAIRRDAPRPTKNK